jgi:PAS domain S-box-containing protein
MRYVPSQFGHPYCTIPSTGLRGVKVSEGSAMKDQDKTKEQLIAELEEMRGRVSALEASAAEGTPIELVRDDVGAELRQVISSVSDYLWSATMDDAGKMAYRYTSPVVEQITGRPVEFFTQCPETWLSILHPEDRPLLQAAISRIASGESISEEHEYRMVRPDGTVRWVRDSVVSRRQAARCFRIDGVVTDITERKRAEELLRQSEQRLSLHFQQAPIAAIEWDVEGRVTKWNPSAERMFGYPREEALGQHFSFIVPQLALERVGHIADGLFSSKGGYRSTNENVTKDGRPILCEWYNTPLIDAEGQIVGAASLAQDITEQKRAEEALQKAHDALEHKVQERTAELRRANEKLQMEVEERRRTQATLDAFFNASTAILNIVDDEFRYIKCDALTASYFNHDSKSIIGRSLKDELAPCFVEEFGPMIRQVIETGTPVHNVEVRSPVPGRPGEIVYWRASYFPVVLPEGTRGYGVVGVEINDIKRAEEALRESEARYRTLVETSPDTVVLADLEGHLTFVSHGILELHGSESLEEFIGRHPIHFMAEEDHQRFLANLNERGRGNRCEFGDS